MTGYLGTLAGNNLNLVVATGFYTLTAACSNGPAGAFVGALFHVEAHGTSYAIQRYLSISNPTIGWERIIRPDAGIYKPWCVLPSKPLADKSIVCFGDSVTEGSAYPSLLALRTGAVVTKAGFGGCRMAQHSQPLYDPMSMYQLSGYIANGSWGVLTAAANALFASNGDDNRSQSAALAALNWNDVHHAVVFFGTNDFSGHVPLGASWDTNGSTFKGAINQTITNILDAYPHIQLMFVTPLWRARDGGSAVDQNNLGLYLADYVDAISERAEAHQVEVFDLFRTCGVNLLNHTHWLSDELHPTPAGAQMIASKIGAALEARF